MSHHDDAIAAAPGQQDGAAAWLAWVEHWYPYTNSAHRALVTRFRNPEEPQRPEHLVDLAGIEDRRQAAALARQYFRIREHNREWRERRAAKVATGAPQSFNETRSDLFDALDDRGWG